MKTILAHVKSRLDIAEEDHWAWEHCSRNYSNWNAKRKTEFLKLKPHGALRQL